MGSIDFDGFARREMDGLLRYATVLTGDCELAADLVQDVLVKAYRRWPLVAAADHPRAYVRTMVTRAYLSWRRSWRPRVTASTRATAVLGAAATVAAIAVGISVAASGGGSHHATGASNPSTSSITAPVRNSTALGTAEPSAVPATDVPKTQAALIARFRSILGDTATFTVDYANSTDNMITGVLTSTSGTRGMYVLELDKNVAICGAMSRIGQTATALPCPHLTTLPDGSKLKIDPNFPDGPPDGVMNDAILSRPDGWQISLYTANVQGKYYGAPVLGKKPALTVQQVTGVVTSPEWLTK